MPEASEIKISTEQINDIFKDRRVIDLSFLSTGRYHTVPPAGYETFELLLQAHPNGLVAYAGCVGKLQHIDFYADTVWLSCAFLTHGMTGHWIKMPVTKHVAASLKLDDGTTLSFEDMRRFGTFKFVFSRDEMRKKIETLGFDILTTPIDALADLVVDSCCGAKNVTEFLMSQKWLAGVGNYIKAEALYRAKISPHRSMVSLTKNEAKLLARSVKAVAQESYETQGLYFRNHVTINGGAGTFKDFLAVYRKKFDPQGNAVVSEKTLDKRTTWWAPAVQK